MIFFFPDQEEYDSANGRKRNIAHEALRIYHSISSDADHPYRNDMPADATWTEFWELGKNLKKENKVIPRAHHMRSWFVQVGARERRLEAAGHDKKIEKAEQVVAKHKAAKAAALKLLWTDVKGTDEEGGQGKHAALATNFKVAR